MTKTTLCEIKLGFNDGEPITMRDKDLIEHIPLLTRAIASQTADWKTEDVVVADTLRIPFAREAAEFLFRYVRQYPVPGEYPELAHYPDAASKTAEELKEIIELANFLECLEFVEAIGFVIAQKLKDWDVTRIAQFMGLECVAAEDGYEEDNEWMHPPLAALQGENNNYIREM